MLSISGCRYTVFVLLLQINVKCLEKFMEKVVFNESWLGDERFKTWLKRGNDCHKAVCIYATTVLLTLQEWV